MGCRAGHTAWPPGKHRSWKPHHEPTRGDLREGSMLYGGGRPGPGLSSEVPEDQGWLCRPSPRREGITAGSRRLRAPVPAALLLAVLLGAGGGEETAPEPRATAGNIMIPAGGLRPTSDNWDHPNNGSYVQVDAGIGTFVASLSSSVSDVSIKRITPDAYDDDGTCSVGLELLRPFPPRRRAPFRLECLRCTGRPTPGSSRPRTSPPEGEHRGARVAPGGLPVGTGRPALRGAEPGVRRSGRPVGSPDVGAARSSVPRRFGRVAHDGPARSTEPSPATR